ncbi:hypothetical protein SI65_01615 [Aspergillus cristatus]|uniref:Leucine Rich Repeat domain protein n=1 Tax=Aspergillus cristatus TaxID=573508 RepID=A0A1E3BSW8_ASPCR|nr:hypothetical protein SI65_01615 [Aspergillus cristatus]
MEKLNTEDGQLFIKNLASFVRTHEKALANALQLRRTQSAHVSSTTSSSSGGALSSTSSTLASALSFGALKLGSQGIKPAKLTLTPHHLFYLLSRFEDLSISVGPMSVRLENIHNDVSQSYVSFLNKPQRSRGDRDSIHSVSSVRSVMSGMSALWSSFGISKDSSTKSEKAKAALEADLKYLYSAFTKIPCLRLAPDHRARLIRGYEEFPFDTAVPLHSFKNLSALEVIDIDYRSFFGWDRLSEQLRTLTIKRANVEDPADLLTGIVLDDIDKRRRRSSKAQGYSPMLSSSGNGHSQMVRPEWTGSLSVPNSPVAETALGSSTSSQAASMLRVGSEGSQGRTRTESNSPTRPASSRHSIQRHTRHSRIRRTGSGSSNSSENSGHYRSSSSSNLLLSTTLPPSKWRFLRHLGLPDNSLTTISTNSLAPVANTLHSLDLSSNLFTDVPDSLASLIALRALNLSHCMIESLHSLSRNPLPAITALNLRGNRLRSLAGIERLLSLERLDLRDNLLTDPMEIARLTCLPEIREIWISGNPFVKTYSGNRVVIFNLFRRTPGYSVDIIIDGTGPGYTERKHLVERVAEPEGAPIIRAPVADHSAVVSKSPSTAVAQQAPVPVARPGQAPGEVRGNARDVGAPRRRRANRRRIVDVPKNHKEKPLKDGKSDSGTTVTPVLSTIQHVQVPNEPQFAAASDRQWKSDGGSQGGPHQSQSNHERPGDAGTTAQTPRHGADWNMEGDLYIRQLEALRQEVWLNALGDRSRPREVNVPRTGTPLDESTRIPADTIPRACSNQIIIGGDRT